MYTVKSGICVLSPDMFIGMRNKQEACEDISCEYIYISSINELSYKRSKTSFECVNVKC